MKADDCLVGWHVHPSSTREYEFLDGIRGVAILMVVICHIAYVNPNAGWLVRFLGKLISTGSTGVPLFFALSGFLISIPFWKAKIRGANSLMPPGFAQRRFFKVYPPLALSVLIFAPLYALIYRDPAYFRIGLEWLIGAPLVVPIYSPLNPVMWSLVVEVQFYLVLPFLVFLFRRKSVEWCLIGTPAALIILGYALRLPLIIVPEQGRAFSEIRLPFPSFQEMFPLGVFIAGLHCTGRLKKEQAWLGNLGALLLVFIVFYFAWQLMHPLPFWHLELIELSIKIACGLILFYIADPRCPAARALAHPVLRWLGIISYEWYLVHQPLILWTRLLFGPMNGNGLRYALVLSACFLVTLGLGAIFYRFYSLPLLRWGRNRAPR